jgi:hypothetical protein
MYDATIRKRCEDDKTGDWKETSSYSPTDLAAKSQPSSQAFQTIGELKSQGCGR